MSIQNPRTFLELCQRAAIECAVATSASITRQMPTLATVDASSSLGRIINWVSDAWTDIQMDHDDWDWMRSSNIIGAGVSFATVNNQPGSSYPLGIGAGTVGVDPENFGKWDVYTFRCHTTAVGHRDESPLPDVGYDYWRNTSMWGANQDVRTRPTVMAVGPDQSICLGLPSNGNYTVTGDYWLAPSNMVLDTDIPLGLPSRFTMLIVYRTMMKCAADQSAPELYQRGSQENDGMYAQLQAARAPRISWSGALA